jgi:hypothetical protein
LPSLRHRRARENGAVEAAYDREEMLEHRREVMERWANFLSDRTSDNVVPLRRGAAGE